MEDPSSLIADPWRAPVNLGAAVNSPENEWCPGISPDGLTLIVNSTRPGGMGGEDLWMSTRPGGEGFFDVWQVTLAKPNRR